MPNEIFVSHAFEDKAAAQAVCAVLTAQGINCRTISVGTELDDSSAGAIKSSRAMILIFTANSNRSAQIRYDVEQAANFRIPVIPLRIENAAPTGSLDYFISRAGAKGRIAIEDAASAPENF